MPGLVGEHAKSADGATLGTAAAPREDAETQQWLAMLRATGRVHDAAVDQLHAMLLRVTRAEANRRSTSHGLAGPELDDLAHQAAADALVAITAKLDQFRGESRFTTWAYKFAVLEVASKLGRHFWRRHPTSVLDAEEWDRLPDRFGLRPDDHAQNRDLVDAVRAAVDTVLSERQRTVFLALVVNGVPLEALVAESGSSRNAIYKTMFDARRKLRAALAADGYLPGEDSPARTSPGGQSDVDGRPRTLQARLEQFLRTDPTDVGCEEALRILHIYASLVLDERSDPVRTRRAKTARVRFPGIAAHLAACGPCGQDFDGLLAAIQAGDAPGGRPGSDPGQSRRQDSPVAR